MGAGWDTKWWYPSRLEDRPELHGPAALEAWDGRLAGADDALAEDQLEFWTNICLCHSLIVEPNPAGGLPVYQVRCSRLCRCIPVPAVLLRLLNPPSFAIDRSVSRRKQTVSRVCVYVGEVTESELTLMQLMARGTALPGFSLMLQLPYARHRSSLSIKPPQVCRVRRRTRSPWRREPGSWASSSSPAAATASC